MTSIRRKRPADRRERRGGVVTLELILALPILVISVAAVVEFGLILSNLKHIEFASRVGAKVASEETNGDLPTAVATVRAKVEKVLSGVGISSCQVILEHNVPATCVVGGTTQSSGTCANCGPPADPLPAPADLPGGAVRVTVCVELSEVTPNLLAAFGFSTANRTINTSTTFAYENCTP